MNVRVLVAVGFRLLALWICLSAFFLTIDNIQLNGANSEAIIGHLIVFVVFLITAAFFWLFPMTIAGKFVPQTTQNQVSVSFTKYHLAKVGVSLLAIFIIALSLWVIPATATFVLDKNQSFNIINGDASYLMRGFVELFAGVMILFNGTRIAAFIVKENA